MTENIIFRQIAPKYHPLARAVADIGSNGASYLLGKSQGEKNQSNNQNGN